MFVYETPAYRRKLRNAIIKDYVLSVIFLTISFCVIYWLMTGLNLVYLLPVSIASLSFVGSLLLSIKVALTIMVLKIIVKIIV